MKINASLVRSSVAVLGDCVSTYLCCSLYGIDLESNEIAKSFMISDGIILGIVKASLLIQVPIICILYAIRFLGKISIELSNDWHEKHAWLFPVLSDLGLDLVGTGFYQFFIFNMCSLVARSELHCPWNYLACIPVFALLAAPYFLYLRHSVKSYKSNNRMKPSPKRIN